MTDGIKFTKRQRILNSPTKCIKECENCLAALWRIILKDLNITEEKWNTLMNIYLTDPVNGFSNETKTLGDKRGNLNKALCDTKMQMLILNRALRFLRTERATLTFTLYPAKIEDYPVTTYDINILYGESEKLQKTETLKEDRVSEKIKSRGSFLKAIQKISSDSGARKYSGNNTLDEWLEDPTKMISSATGPLSKVWRRILVDRDVTKSIWKTLTVKYQRLRAPDCEVITGKETVIELKSKSKQKSNIKGNITDELQRPAFTIDVFMKGMVFLEIEKVDISLRLKRSDNDRITTHVLRGWETIKVLDKYLK